MTLAAFVFFLAGAVSELVLLRGGARRKGQAVFGAPAPGTAALITAIVLAGALGAVLLLRVAGLADIRVSLDDAWVGAIFVGLGLFLLAVGVLVDGLLPKVNKRSILVVQLLVALLALSAPTRLRTAALVLLVGLPLFGSAVLVAWRRVFPAPVKALVYLGYLLALLVMSYQTANWALFTQNDLTPADGLALGGLFIFLTLHALFAVRFFLIVSSLILPRNRAPLGRLMARLFSDEQMPGWRFGLFCAGAAGLILLNARLDLVDGRVVTALAVLVGSQLDL